MRELDSLDEGIMREVERDPRASYTELAKRLGVSQGTIRNRFAYLLEHDVLRIVAYKNPNLSGTHVRAFVGFDIVPQHLTECAERLALLPELRYMALSVGDYNLVALTEFDSRGAMLRFMTETIPSFPEIRRVSIHVLLGVMKRLGGITHTVQEVASD